MNLQETLTQALNEKWALPHFNISNAVQLRGIMNAAEELKSPIMIGTSGGEADFISYKVSRALVSAEAERTGIPVFLNADHFHSVEKCIEAIDAGYDSVIIDMSKEDDEKNIEATKAVVEYAKKDGRDVHVEAELGYLVTDSSKIYKEEIEIPIESFTDPEQARVFVEDTKVDRFAAAFGTLHGIAANKPVLDFDRIVAIRKAIGDGVALVLHGGSGVVEEDFKKAIASGVNNVHISTHLRLAYTNALRVSLAADPEQATPYKFYAPVVEAVAEEAKKFIILFGSENKA